MHPLGVLGIKITKWHKKLPLLSVVFIICHNFLWACKVVLDFQTDSVSTISVAVEWEIFSYRSGIFPRTGTFVSLVNTSHFIRVWWNTTCLWEMDISTGNSQKHLPYIYIYVWVYIYIYIYIYTYIYTYILIYLYLYIYTYISVCVCVHARACVCVSVSVFVSVCLCVCVCVSVCLYVCTCVLLIYTISTNILYV